MALCRYLHISIATVPRGAIPLFRVVLDVVALQSGELIESEL